MWGKAVAHPRYHQSAAVLLMEKLALSPARLAALLGRKNGNVLDCERSSSRGSGTRSGLRATAWPKTLA